MKRFRRGTSLSIIFLIVGFTLIPEPIDAVPKGYRDFKKSKPSSRCRSHSRDCSEKLSDAGTEEDSWQIHILKPTSTTEVTYSAPQTAPEYIKLELSPQNQQQAPSESYPKLPSPPVLPSEIYKPPVAPAVPYAKYQYATQPEAPAAHYSRASSSAASVPQPCPVPPSSVYPKVKPTLELEQPAPQPPPPPSYSPRYPKAQSLGPFYPQNLIHPTSPIPRKIHRERMTAPCHCSDLQSLNFDYNPFSVPEYLPSPLKSGRRSDFSPCNCDCDGFFDLDEESLYSRPFHRRSLDEKEMEKAPSKYFERAIPFPEDALNAPSSMYKNYRPYERRAQPEDYDDEDDEEAPRGRERLYVVYRADAFDDDEKPSEQELESVIRQAIESTRRQKTQRRYSLDGPAYPRYFYDRPGGFETEHVELRGLEDNELKDKERTDSMSIRSIGDDAEKFFTSGTSDEAKNPGTDQSKWTVIPTASGVNQKEERVGVEEIDTVVDTAVDAAANLEGTTDDKDAKVEKIIENVEVTVADKDDSPKKTNDEPVAKKTDADVVQVDQKKDADSKTQNETDAKIEKFNQKTVDKEMELIMEMETPSPLVTEPTNFDNLPTTATNSL